MVQELVYVVEMPFIIQWKYALKPLFVENMNEAFNLDKVLLKYL